MLPQALARQTPNLVCLERNGNRFDSNAEENQFALHSDLKQSNEIKGVVQRNGNTIHRLKRSLPVHFLNAALTRKHRRPCAFWGVACGRGKGRHEAYSWAWACAYCLLAIFLPAVCPPMC